MPPTPLAELAASVRRLERLRSDCPERYRPTAAVVYATVEAVKADVIAATERGRRYEALAIVADFEREAGALVTAKMLHAPIGGDSQ